MLVLNIPHRKSKSKIIRFFGNGYPTTIVDRPLLASWVADSR